MKINFLSVILLLFACSVNGQTADPKFENLRILIKDTTLLNELKRGIFKHPALEIGFKKPYSETIQKNYPIKIAIDIGHIANNKKEALIEDRFINSQYGFFYESELAMSTGLWLKQLFEARGFEVMLTRAPGTTAVGPTFTKWLKTEFKKELKKDLASGAINQDRYDNLLRSTPKDIFNKYFKDKDFIARGNKINAFNPDIVLVIHYNASEFANNSKIYSPTVSYNYSVCFVPGGFTNVELQTENQLEDFIRLASSDLINKSVVLSSYVVNEFENKLGAPALVPEDHPDLWYLRKYSVYTKVPGVFGRNLYITRALNSPVCYGECFLQNNSLEIKRLAKKDFKVGPYKVSSRVKDVGDCYYSGVIKYFQHLGWIN